MRDPAARPSGPAARRLAAEYLRPNAAALGLAAVCMIAAAAGTAALAYMLDPAIKLIFLEKRNLLE